MASSNVAEATRTTQTSSKQHPVFLRFPIYKGPVPAGYFANFLGVLTKLDYFTLARPEIEEGYHQNYPHLDELYFEWIDVLQAVTTAEKHFTLIELGAGWGRWTANAAAALKLSNRLPYTLIGVEAEPTHFQWMREHLETNGVDLDCCQLIEAAATGRDGTVGFHTGKHETWGGPTEWYGQSVGGPVQVRAVSLKSILAPLEKVDLLDMDIQGAEFEVVDAAANEIQQKVKRVHIETHNREVEQGLRTLFTQLGWKAVHDYPCSLEYPKLLESNTDFGVVGFLGGVQSWVNPKFVGPSELASLTDKLVNTSLGFDLRVDPGDYVGGLLQNNGIYEIAESDLVSRVVRPKDICIDAGCHIGYFSCLMGMLAGPEGRVYAFDANPLQVERAARNAEINGLSNVQAIHAALGDQSGGTALFNVATDDQTGLSSLGNISNCERTIKVPWLRLDKFLQEHHVRHVRLLKLDVEGAEEMVLIGLGEFLTNGAIDFILLECNDERLKLLDSSTERVAKVLEGKGYAGWEFNDESNPAWRPVLKVRSREDANLLFCGPSIREAPAVSLAGVLLRTQKELRNLSKQGSAPERPIARRVSIASPAEAFWRQREMLASSKERIKALSAAIGRPSDLTPAQWAQIAAFTQDFGPDLILELGRGMGNSTAAFTEVAHHLGGAQKCRVLSLCLSDSWRKQSVPKIRKIVTPEWFAPLEALECDILRFDIAARLQNTQRVVVFWDAHGFEMAEWVLGELLPKIAFKPHLVMMHDLADMRYCAPQRLYGDERLWKGTSAGEESMWLGHIHSRVAQSISIIDFTSRNKLPLHSGDESFFREIGQDPQKKAVLQHTLGDELFQLNCLWFWFSLSEAEEELTFPRFELPSEAGTFESDDITAMRRELYAIKNSRGWRVLSSMHRIRDKVAPQGTVRRKIYQTLMRPSSGKPHV